MAISNVEALFAESLNELELTTKQKSVLRASLTLFSAKGFDGTSTKDIAQMAGVSEGTVYKQFKTKEGILNAVLGPFVQQVAPKVAGEFLDTFANTNYPSAQAFLTEIVKDRLTFFSNNKMQLKILAQELLSNPALTQQLVDEVLGRIMTRLTTTIHFYQEKGQLVNWQPSRIVRYFISTMFGYVVPSLFEIDQELDIEHDTDEIVEFLMRGLAK